MCVAGRDSLSVPANRGRWVRRKKSRIIEQSGKPHHFIFIDGQLVKAMGYVVPSEYPSVNTDITEWNVCHAGYSTGWIYSNINNNTIQTLDKYCPF